MVIPHGGYRMSRQSLCGCRRLQRRYIQSPKCIVPEVQAGHKAGERGGHTDNSCPSRPCYARRAAVHLRLFIRCHAERPKTQGPSAWRRGWPRKHRQFGNISASKSFRSHICGRLGGSGGRSFLPRTHLNSCSTHAAGGSDLRDHALRLRNRGGRHSLSPCCNR